MRFERDADDAYDADYEERVGTKTKGIRLEDSVAIVLREPYDGSEFEGITDEEGKEVWELLELLGGLGDTSELSWLELREEFYDKYEMLNDAKDEFGYQHSVAELLDLIISEEGEPPTFRNATEQEKAAVIEWARRSS